MEFSPSESYSVGVELEFQILDRNELNLVPLAPVLIEQSPDLLRPRLSIEFIKSILEVQTGVCTNLRDVENDLLQTISLAEELAADHQAMLYAASLHPFARAFDQELSEDERYERIMEELQIVGRRFISQGLHVHVGMPDGDTAIKVCNVVQAFLPLFLSLSSSSPFYQARDTGLMSYRTKLFEVLPLAGIYDYFTDWNHFVRELRYLKGHGIIGSLKDLWFDARPNYEFGTVEIRACDLPSRFSDLLAMVALIQCCVVWIAEEIEDAEPLHPMLLKANKWQAARHGLRGRFVDPSGLLGENAMSYQSAAMILKGLLVPFAARLQCEHYFNHLDTVLAEGTGAGRMRDIYRRTGDFRTVVTEVQKGFWE